MQFAEQDPDDRFPEQKEPEVQRLIKDGCDSLDLETYNTEKNEKAENFFRDALKIDPKNRRALCGLGMAQALRKKWDSALKNYECVLAQNPEYVNQPAEVVQKDREYVYALRGKSYCLLNLEKFPEAIDQLTRYTELRPEDPRGWFNKGFSLFLLEKYEESEKYFEKFLEVEPGGSKRRTDAFNFQAFVAYNQNDLEKADKFFERAYAEDPLSFGALITRKLVQDKRFYIKQQQELIETARRYLKCLLKDFRTGLSIVQYMFIIQFFTGLGLLVYALFLAASGKNEILTYIAGASGGLIAILSLVFSAPADLQKNRVDFSQWMIAYFNWINTLYAVSGAVNQKSRGNKEVRWDEIQPLQDYLNTVTASTITTMEQCCEFSKKSNFPIPGLTSAAATGSTAENTPTIQTGTETKVTPQGTQTGQPQNTPDASEPNVQGAPEEQKPAEPPKGTVPGTDDFIATVQKLAELNKSGILTAEELAALKKKLLGI